MAAGPAQDDRHGVQRPRIAPSDVPVMLWREKWLAALVFLFIVGLGVFGLMMLRPTYGAEARLLVLFGQEYVYQPRVGAAGEGQIPRSEQIIQSEIEIITSTQVIERAISAIGLSRLFPDMKPPGDGPPQTPQARLSQAVKMFKEDFGASTTPNTSVIKVTFAHRDPQMAALALNTLVDQYLAYRREVFADDRAGALLVQRQGFEDRLDQLDREISGFLAANGVSDFDTDRRSVADVSARVRNELFDVRAKRREAEGRLAAIRTGLTALPREVTMMVESDATKRLLDLELQREELLAKYTPESRPVRELEERIARARDLLASDQAQGAGTIRRGANPVVDAVSIDRERMASEVSALAARERALTSQLAELEARLTRLQQLKSRFDELTREQAVLTTQASQFASRAEEARAINELIRNTSDNIRLFQRATPATQGTSLRRPLFVILVLFALMTALAVALARALLRPGFPTAASAERTLGLPVLARVPA